MNRTAVVQHSNAENLSPFSSGILHRKCTSCFSKNTAENECSECANKKGKLQRKLSIGASNDPLEHEADRIADQVMRMSPNSSIATTAPKIQCASTRTGDADASVPTSVNRILAGSGEQMQPVLRKDMEQRFDHDFSRVRLHTNEAAAKSASDIYADAYTAGNNVVFGAGQFAPGTNGGRKLIAHELAHVIQQNERAYTIQRQPAQSSAAAPVGSSLMFKVQRMILLMCMNSQMRQAFEIIDRDRIAIVFFTTGFDRWRYDNGTIRELPIPGLRGNTDIPGRTIRLNQALSAEVLAITLFHELQHWMHFQNPAGPRGLESEIQARIATEELAIARNRPPTSQGYRTSDGRVDEAAIRRSMATSSHYSPSGRQRIGRRYAGETPISPPLTCPPIGDFPEPLRERAIV